VGIGLSLAAHQPAAVYAAVAASMGALCALSALIGWADRGVNGVLTGFAIGFLCRALIAVGLLASGARGDAALVYVFTFFALYASTQVIEVLYVHFNRPQRATP
jgi:hypothetical protein